MADNIAQASTQQTEDQQRARDRGKQVMMEAEDIDLMNLKPQDFGKPLDLKVYRKWISKNIPDPSPTGISFILLDKKGGAIQANGQLPDMRQLDSRLQLDACYRIQGYGCKRTDNWQRTLDNKITLLFGRFTQAAPIQDEGFPKHYFNFAAYNEVCHRADTREPILTDYVGIIRNIGTIREFGDATTNIISRRNIDVQNLNGNTVMLTLWNELATEFPVARVEEMERPVVIAASSCWAKRHAGIIQLSSTPATSIYLNPKVPTAEHIREVIIIAYIYKQQQQHFITDAVIVKIDESRGWYFNRCRSCGNPVEEHMPHRHCHEPGTQPQPNYSPAAHSLVPNITELLSYVPDRDLYTLPPIVKDLENTKRRFQIHLGKGSRKGYPSFILDNASDISPPTSPQTYIESQGESSSTPAVNITGEQQPEEITPGSVSPPPSTSTPAGTILHITTSESQVPADIAQPQLTTGLPQASAATTETILRLTGPETQSPAEPTEPDLERQHPTSAEPTEAAPETEHSAVRRQLFTEQHEENVEESKA
ncbi:nucleic acid-binding, OB-fold protein [Artemisia annua]|uniref:Nucleic acid-binding, OB-fold protein n=1 Tax=Artemisia annua TaxID=35608 RepID=A0A2U1KF81_ARTAN|nr:nucleic acid-binding, OB-fold protein [Artemisia annua]